VSDVTPTAAPAEDGAPGASPTASASARSTTRVVDAPELENGARLMVEAYAAIWIIVLGLVVVMWRRTRSLEARVGVIDAAIAKTNAAGPAPAAGASKASSSEAVAKVSKPRAAAAD
jgi:hypothetical protein